MVLLQFVLFVPLYKNLKEFFFKRVKKIFPPYLSVVLFFAVFLFFFSTFSFKNYFTSVDLYKYLIANVSTLNFIHPSLPGVFNGQPVNGLLWTIKVEIGFYIILPLIALLCVGKSNNKSKIINIGCGRCIAILSIVYLCSCLYGIFIPLTIKRYHLPSSLINQLPYFMSYFTVGLFFFFFYEKMSSMPNWLIIPSLILLFLCIVLDNVYLTVFIQPIVLALVIMWLALKAKPLFIFSKVYDFSYWMYLIHYPIIMIINDIIC